MICDNNTFIKNTFLKKFQVIYHIQIWDKAESQ